MCLSDVSRVIIGNLESWRYLSGISARLDDCAVSRPPGPTYPYYAYYPYYCILPLPPSPTSYYPYYPYLLPLLPLLATTPTTPTTDGLGWQSASAGTADECARPTT